MSARSFADRARHLVKGRALFAALALLLAGCNSSGAGSPNLSSDTGYYNAGNCFDNGRPGYTRDYSYGDRYLLGQSRSC